MQWWLSQLSEVTLYVRIYHWRRFVFSSACSRGDDDDDDEDEVEVGLMHHWLLLLLLPDTGQLAPIISLL